jgi:uroporphyrinogen-III synthase
MTSTASILSTRPLPQDVLDEAGRNDIVIDVISFIRTEALPAHLIQQQITGELSANIVFTSMTAVEAVASSVKSAKSVTIFCIGNATAKLVGEHFGNDVIKGTAENAAALADVIIDAGIKEVVFFCGDQRRDELPATLRAHNITVTEITVYRTIATPQKINKDYSAMLFFSPSAVESFFSENNISNGAVLFAIGDTTANAIKKFTANQVIIGDEPGKEALARKAIEYLTSQQSKLTS